MARLRPLHTLTFRGQVSRYETLAHAVLSTSYPALKSPELSLLVHGENTTFKVTDAANVCFVLRIHREGYQTTEAIRAELGWVKWLQDTEGFPAPVAVPNAAGELVSFGECAGVGQRRCVLFTWIEGVHKREVPLEVYAEMGRLLGVLHRTSAHVPYPLAAARQELGELRCFTMDWQGCVGEVSPGLVRQIEAVVVAVHKDLQVRRNDPTQYGLIHSDMHLGNVLFGAEGEVTVIDFDDAMRAPFLYDFATACLSVNSDSPTTPKGAWEALLEGYTTEYALAEQFERGLALCCAARRVNMVEWFLTRRDNSKIWKHFPEYVEGLEGTLKGYMSVWER